MAGKAPTPDPRQDFKVFLRLLWHHLNLPEPTPVQLDIADYLQHGPKRRVVEAFRGVGKSWITSAFVLWKGWNKRGIRCLVVSASKERSDAFSTFTKRLLRDVPFLREMAPIAEQGDRDSNIAFDFHGSPAAHAPSVKSVGVYGQMTGSRADLIVFDDAEVPNNSETVTQREKLLRRVLEGGAAVLSPGGEVVYLGTPQTEDSLYNHLPDHGYEMRVWPARVPSDPARYGGRLAPIVSGQAGTPTDPRRFDVDELREREVEYGAAGFALQFMLDTTLADVDRYPLKLADFMVLDVGDMAPEKVVWGSGPEQILHDLPNPGFKGDRWHRPMWVSEKFHPFELTVMYIDPSGRGGDETGYCIVRTLHGTGYIVEWGGMVDGYAPATLSALAHLAAKYNVKTLWCEDNFGDGMWLELFKPVLQRIHTGGCAVEGERVTGQKEARITERLGPALGGHKLVIDKALVRKSLESHENPLKSNFHQLTRLKRDRGSLKHDDRIEALAGAVFIAMRQLARDSEKAIAVTKDAAWRKELDKFGQYIYGNKHGGPKVPRTWTDRC